MEHAPTVVTREAIESETRALQRRLRWLALLVIAQIIFAPAVFSSVPGLPIFALWFFPIGLGVLGGFGLWRHARIEMRRIVRLSEPLPIWLSAPHPIDECWQLLQDAPQIHSGNWLAWLRGRMSQPLAKRKQAQLSFDALGWRLQKRASETVFVGRLRADGNRTVVEGFFDFYRDPLDKIYPYLWFSFVALMGAFTVVTVVGDLMLGKFTSLRTSPPMFLVLGFLAASMWAMLRFRQWQAERHARWLLQLLQSTLGAQVIDENRQPDEMRPPLL